MAFTTEDLRKMEEAIASGVRSVQIGNNIVQYQTVDALITAYKQARLLASSQNPLRFKVGIPQ
jgi:hypothetical protein